MVEKTNWKEEKHFSGLTFDLGFIQVFTFKLIFSILDEF